MFRGAPAAAVQAAPIRAERTFHESDAFASPIEFPRANIVSVLPIREGLHDESVRGQQGLLEMQRMWADLESVAAGPAALRLDSITAGSSRPMVKPRRRSSRHRFVRATIE